ALLIGAAVILIIGGHFGNLSFHSDAAPLDDCQDPNTPTDFQEPVVSSPSPDDNTLVEIAETDTSSTEPPQKKPFDAWAAIEHAHAFLENKDKAIPA
ncbi:hypothetical protein PMAYCL1PPCAC_32800, partial [Pristionchus mayeri]